jgi:hypothetical protein
MRFYRHSELCTVSSLSIVVHMPLAGLERGGFFVGVCQRRVMAMCKPYHNWGDYQSSIIEQLVCILYLQNNSTSAAQSQKREHLKRKCYKVKNAERRKKKEVYALCYLHQPQKLRTGTTLKAKLNQKSDDTARRYTYVLRNTAGPSILIHSGKAGTRRCSSTAAGAKTFLTFVPMLSGSDVAVPLDWSACTHCQK